jgi:hypothetical protein
MGTFDESFGEELSKLAQIVETIDNSFLKKGDVTLNIKLTERDFVYLTQKLGNSSEDKRCTISIENVNFIFSRM